MPDKTPTPRSKAKPAAPSRGETEAAAHRARANQWTDEQRAELDSGVMAFFYGKTPRTRTPAHRR